MPSAKSSNFCSLFHVILHSLFFTDCLTIIFWNKQKKLMMRQHTLLNPINDFWRSLRKLPTMEKLILISFTDVPNYHLDFSIYSIFFLLLFKYSCEKQTTWKGKYQSANNTRNSRLLVKDRQNFRIYNRISIKIIWDICMYKQWVFNNLVLY